VEKERYFAYLFYFSDKFQSIAILLLPISILDYLKIWPLKRGDMRNQET